MAALYFIAVIALSVSGAVWATYLLVCFVVRLTQSAMSTAELQTRTTLRELMQRNRRAVSVLHEVRTHLESYQRAQGLDAKKCLQQIDAWLAGDYADEKDALRAHFQGRV